MKTNKALIITMTALIFIITAAAVSAAPLSPGLDVIAEDSAMIKAGMTGSDITFALTDFKNATCSDVSRGITVTGVPSADEGTLMLGSVAVTAGQSLPSDSLDRLRFVAEDGVSASSFSFTTGNSYNYECVIKLIGKMNAAPVIADGGAVSVWTQKDVSFFGCLSGYDPDGDAVEYEIVSYPSKGIVAVTDRAAGDYKYTPYDSATGTDQFTYRIRDEYGNYSETAVVKIEIDAPRSDVVFADMDEHPAKNAAIVMDALDVMKAEEADGKLYFKPDEKVSRMSFLKMAMDALGADKVPTVKETIFADDADIPADMKGYVSAAYSLGIVKGVSDDTGLFFMPNAPITKSEAAVILNNIIGAEPPETVPVFADSDSVPAWAKNAVYALSSLGIFGTRRGCISANAEMTRADCAELLTALGRKLR